MISVKSAKFIASYATAEQLPASTKPEVSFVGRSNVGKSTLINKLCNNKSLAKVSSTPGKTTAINFFDAGDIYLVDLPGYGFAKRSKGERARWSSLIDEYFNQERNFEMVYVLLDIRHDPSDLDLQMIAYLRDIGIPFEIHFTKEDKLSKQKGNAQKQKILKIVGQ
ncbi:MAG: ribosome biogenesis GTP-binding protein YihA/YsxC [Coriobacteriia bacterium]|nr:ribosome biogenesis GTP-binding protein YihA/YsxC [Coriobacteriia bacterium]